MAATYGAVNTASGSSAAPAVNAPAGDNTGKLLLANVRGSGVGTSVTGWENYLGATTWWFSGSSTRSWWRIGDGTSADNFATTSSNATWEASIVRVEGADTDSPISDYTSGAVGNPSGATFDLPDETVAADGSLAITFAASNGSNDNTPTTIPGSYTVRASEGSRSYFVATSPVNTGTGGGGTWVMSGGVRYGGQVVIVNPADSEPPEPNPGIDTMVAEDFAGGIPEWLLVDPRGDGDQDNVDTSGGVLRIGYATGSFDDGVVVTTGEFERCDLTGRRVVFDVELLHLGLIELYSGVQFAVGDTDSVGFRIYRTSSDLVVGWWETVFAEEVFDGGTLDTRTYSTTSHRYLSIRESSGTVYIEASPDNATWTTLASRAISAMPSFDAEAVQVALHGTTNTIDTGGIFLRAINPAADDDVEAAAAPVAVSAAVVPATASIGTVEAPARSTAVVARVLAATVTIGAITAPAVPVQATVRSAAASASTAAISAPAPAIRTTARVLAADVVIGSIEATAPSVRVGVRAVPATAQQVAGAVDSAATRVAVRAVPGSASIGPLTAGVPALSVGARVLPATVTLGGITAESRPVVASARAVTASAQQVTGAVGSAPVALSARVAAADASVHAVAAESAPARVLARVVAADVTIGALTVESAPVAVSVRSIPAVGHQVVGAVAAVPVRVSAQVLAADVVIGAVSATAPPVRVTIAATPAALAMGTITAPARPVRVGLAVTTASSPEAVTATAAPVRVVARVLAADVTIGGLTPFPRERRFTPLSRSHQFESLTQTSSFRATVRSHTLEVPSD